MTTAARTVPASKSAPAKSTAKTGGQRGTAALLALARARRDASAAMRADAIRPASLASAASAMQAALDDLRKLAENPRETADWMDADGRVVTSSVAQIVGALSGIRASAFLSGALKLAK